MATEEAIRRRNASPEHKQRVKDQRAALKQAGFVEASFWTTRAISERIREIAKMQRDGLVNERAVLDALLPLPTRSEACELSEE